MKYVRTVRSYQALTVTHNDKQLVISSTPQEVADEAAKLAQEAGERYDVAVEVSDKAFDAATVRAGVGSSTVPDLARGVGAISGFGAPVETFGAVSTSGSGEPVETVAEAAGTPTPEADQGSTTTTTGKGK